MGYVFDPARLCEISKIGIGLPHPEMFRVITDELARSFPGRITTEPEWFFDNAGGAMGMLTILYASWKEYLIFFGTPIDTTGHTGRYSFIEDHCSLLDGEMWYYAAGQTEKTVYRPGGTIYLGKGQAKCYRVVDHAGSSSLPTARSRPCCRSASPIRFSARLITKPSSGPSGSTADM